MASGRCSAGCEAPALPLVLSDLELELDHSDPAGLPWLVPEHARIMGTSLEMIERTYGHLLPDALERGRAALEAFDAKSDEKKEAAR